ncbi:P-II family nitrogen regulator [Alkalicoccus urumqiensis]|uniref:PII family protein n=1 Tax=Alkalicoccus urumqiensis TaxID=1548213 RepID=A0A2P6ME36_ALKUR|nr:P-II family nitrogen regulator [Alkalicoccus urumqiensis]PRO64549.1 PII family protein [Alkalicoccus urumqiensis]
MKTFRGDHKIMVTIVKRGKASRLVKASKKAGASGGTILLGEGVGIHEKRRFFGVDALHEKEILLTLAPEDIFPDIVDAISSAARLHKPGRGIGCILDARRTLGIAHLGYDDSTKELDDMTDDVKHRGFNLIITVVEKGKSGKVIDASNRAGAEGGTVMNGRGSGVNEKAKLLSMQIEPEKDVVLTLIRTSKTDAVLRAIEDDCELSAPGKGVSFVLPVEDTVGINHQLQDD